MINMYLDTIIWISRNLFLLTMLMHFYFHNIYSFWYVSVLNFFFFIFASGFFPLLYNVYFLKWI